MFWFSVMAYQCARNFHMLIHKPMAKDGKMKILPSLVKLDFRDFFPHGNSLLSPLALRIRENMGGGGESP